VHSESAPDGAPLIDWSRQNLLFGVDRNVRTAAREVGERLAIDLVEREQEPSSIGFSGADATGGTVSVNENRVDPFGFLSAEGLLEFYRWLRTLPDGMPRCLVVVPTRCRVR
jgi:hypothetical protein